MISQSHFNSYALLRFTAENLGLKKEEEENHNISTKTEPTPVNLFLQGVESSVIINVSYLDISI